MGSDFLCGEQRFKRFDLRNHLPFVVDCTAGIDVAVALGWLEGRREPFVERIGRLHIVVAVDEHRGLAGGVQPVSVDQGMAFAFNEPCVLHADAFELSQQGLGSLAAIGLVLR